MKTSSIQDIRVWKALAKWVYTWSPMKKLNLSIPFSHGTWVLLESLIYGAGGSQFKHLLITPFHPSSPPSLPFFIQTQPFISPRVRAKLKLKRLICTEKIMPLSNIQKPTKGSRLSLHISLVPISSCANIMLYLLQKRDERIMGTKAVNLCWSSCCT